MKPAHKSTTRKNEPHRAATLWGSAVNEGTCIFSINCDTVGANFVRPLISGITHRANAVRPYIDTIPSDITKKIHVPVQKLSSSSQNARPTIPYWHPEWVECTLLRIPLSAENCVR